MQVCDLRVLQASIIFTGVAAEITICSRICVHQSLPADRTELQFLTFHTSFREVLEAKRSREGGIPEFVKRHDH